MESIELPKRKYKIIYADPPWSYNGNLPTTQKGLHYPVMDTEKICQIPVRLIADDDCVLFLWATWPKLVDAFDVIKAWNFKYKTLGFVWIKTNKTNNKAFFGMGSWTRSNTEICLICTKGYPKRINPYISQIVRSPLREHSRKPDVIRKLIVDLCGDLPRVELFTRNAFKGWDVWGNQVSDTKQDFLDDYI